MLFLICIILFPFEVTAFGVENQSGTISPNEFNQWTIIYLIPCLSGFVPANIFITQSKFSSDSSKN